MQDCILKVADVEYLEKNRSSVTGVSVMTPRSDDLANDLRAAEICSLFHRAG